MSRSIIIAGGGTAGHTLPALAIGEALVARGWDRAQIEFVGARRGSESTLVPDAGFEITLLPGRGVQRRLTLQNVGALAGLVAAVVRAVGLVGRRRPDAMVAVGGFASLACVIAAFLWRVPLVVAEQNAVPGAANRIAARFARASAVAFVGTDLAHAVVTGNPVRSEIAAVDVEVDRPVARDALGIDADRRVVLVFGGSLGSRRINEAVAGLIDRWGDRHDLEVRHIIGTRDWVSADADRARRAPGGINYVPVRYEDHMAEALTVADVVVSRAGATTVAELTTIGIGSILVPLPIATADHQTANARQLVAAGAARLVPDAEFDAARLARELDDVLAGDTSARMATAARSLGRPDAADRVAALVLDQLPEERE